MLLGERRSAVHQDEQFHDPPDVVEVPGRGVQGGHQVDGYFPRGRAALRCTDAVPELATPRLAVLSCDVTGEKDEVSGTDEGDECCRGRRDCGKRNRQVPESVV